MEKGATASDMQWDDVRCDNLVLYNFYDMRQQGIDMICFVLSEKGTVYGTHYAIG